MAKLYAIGGATIDLVGRPYQPLRYNDSNPGRVELSFGGVARNIAENAVKCATEVSLLALFGDDAFGELCYAYCQKIGINLSYSKIIKNQSSATYLALLQDSGEMNLALADMEILHKLEPQDFDAGIKRMNAEDYCAIDTNLSEDILQILCAKIPAKIAMDPISTQKAIRAQSILKYLTVFKPNLMEAELICGFKIIDNSSMKKALDFFIQQGVKEIIITAGEKGIYICNGLTSYHLFHESVTIVNTTGAGDSFLGVYLSYRIKGFDWIEACKWGLCASYLTVQSTETVVINLSDTLLKQTKNKLQIDCELF